MVCVSPEGRVSESEPRVQCIVHHVGSPKAGGASKFEVTFPASTPVKQLIDAVASKYEVDSADIKLCYQSSHNLRIFTEQTEGTLGSIGLKTEYGTRNSMNLEVNSDCGDSARMKRPKTYDAPPEVGQDVASTIPPPPNANKGRGQYVSSSNFNWCSGAATSDKNNLEDTCERHLSYETGFVGLVNQAMTCYLNSLLQALFMTPEFRNALYKWKHDPSQGPLPQKSIPYQLQKLFLNLQTSSKTAVETTELTKSFGWESGDVWQQHDIQELCRVMFDALECEFKNTEQADLINMLYQGKMIDYVKCLECGTEKSKEDVFLDIPLPVRPFGSTKAYKDIEEALKAFVRPEILEENNQYFCDACNKKCNAHKGLKFSKFPYLLTLHLKRFDFDYRIMHRIKLNDKVTFPEILDLNAFIQSGENIEEESLETTIKCDDSSTTDSALDEETNHVNNDTPSFDTDQEDDEGVDMSNSIENEKNILQSLSKGPFVYELYSIMIHSGSASGGHYYAYIKDFTRGEWFCFNDQTVTPITAKDIVKTFGGAPNRSYYNGVLSSSTNAYMLMYRQIDKVQNSPAMTADDFPPHIMDILQLIKENEERERALKAKEDEMVKMKIHCDHPAANQRSTRIYIHNEETLASALTLSLTDLNLGKYISTDQCRLVLYNKNNDEKEMSFDGEEKTSIKEILNNIDRIKKRTNLDFFLETREKDKKFFPYSFGDIALTAYLIDVENCDVVCAEFLRTNPLQSVDEFKEFLKDAIPLENCNVHIAVARNNVVRSICPSRGPSTESLRALGLFSDDRIFIAPIKPEDDSLENFEKCVYELRNVVVLQLALPENLEDLCNSLLIPLLTDKGDPSKAGEPGSVALEGGQKINGIEEELACSGTSGLSDQSASEDSSLTDSERTIIGDTEVGTNDVWLSSGSDSEQLLSPSKPSSGGAPGDEEGAQNWTSDVIPKTSNSFYFHAELITEVAGAPTATGDHKVLKVAVDKNVRMDSFKSELERYVGVAGKYLRLYYVHGETTVEVLSLLNNKDNDKLLIVLHRHLEPYEFSAKLYNFNVNAKSHLQQKPVELILSKKKTVGESKKDVVKELAKKGWKVPVDRLRLRYNESKSPGSILLDEYIWEDRLYQPNSIDLFFQCLDEPEQVTANTVMTVFVRRWNLTTMTLGHFTELVINHQNEFLEKLSELSGLPVENIEFAKPANRLPCEMSSPIGVDLEWMRNEEALLRWKDLSGLIILYKDNREEPKSLTKEEQEEIAQQESSTTAAPSSSPYIVSYSPRKEKGLKINSWNNNKSSNRVAD